MMRSLGLAALLLTTGPCFAADVGVSISVNEPGLYGRVDLGGYPPPRTIYAQPVYVQRGPVAPPPVYLHVPPGHAKNWRRHCARYGACGEPVYFVQDDWYRDVYRPRYREMHGPGRGDARAGPPRPDGRPGDDRFDRHDDGKGRGHDGRGRGDEGRGRGDDGRGRGDDERGRGGHR